MIAKRIKKTQGHNSFKRLAGYVVNAQNGGKGDPADWKLAEYILDNKHEGEKVAYVRVTGCAATDPGMATREILATQARNKRSNGDKSYHLVVSFPEGERPTREQMEAIEDAMVKAIGLQDHQRISATHQNTDNWHLHVAINRVHPKTLRCIEPYYDHLKLQEACREQELEHGLIQDNHTPAPEKTLTGGAAEMEAHANRVSFITWVKDNVAAELVNAIDPGKVPAPLPPARPPAPAQAAPQPAVAGPSVQEGPAGPEPPPPASSEPAEDIGDAPPAPPVSQNAASDDAEKRDIETTAVTTWAEMHALLATRGLVIKPRGAGLIIAHHSDDRIRIKASDVDRSLSMASLTERFGPYEPPSPDMPPIMPIEAYDAGPINATPEVDDLWQRYCAERDAARQARDNAIATLRRDHLRYTHELRGWYRERYNNAKAADLNRGDRLYTYQALAKQRLADNIQRREREKKDRQTLKSGHAVPTWAGFLARELAAGNEAAREPLERFVTRQDARATYIVLEIGIGHSAAVLTEGPRPLGQPHRGR